METAEQRLSKAKGDLQKLLKERLDYFAIRLAPELASSGKLLAEYDAFVIDCIEAGIDPDAYSMVGYAHPNMVKIFYGAKDGDRTSPAYNYDWQGDLQIGDSVVLWRRSAEL